MKILVTGAKGFIGKNLVAELKNRGYNTILEYDKEKDISTLEEYCKHANFVFHLAGVNRPNDQTEYMDGNVGFTLRLIESLKRNNNYCPIIMPSSIQAQLDNLYGKSKKAAEELLFTYGDETGSRILVYRLPNTFGKWCKQNYNSFIATFCYNVTRNLPIQVNDSSKMMRLVYIDDVVNELIDGLEGKENKKGEFCEIPIVYEVMLGNVVELIYSFKKSREDYTVPNTSDEFTKKLYSTYLSYLPENEFVYDLKMNIDSRGSFTEFLKTDDRGQISVNILKSGIVKGNHWHNTKNEKFLVVSGKGVVRFRKIDSDKVIEYFVSGSKLEVIDIPIGYTHNIENIGDDEMVTIMWANEQFESSNPDTHFMEV